MKAAVTTATVPPRSSSTRRSRTRSSRRAASSSGWRPCRSRAGTPSTGSAGRCSPTRTSSATRPPGRSSPSADDVTDRAVGDRVVATSSHGSHAELFAVSARTTWKIPEGADVAAAACVPVAFGTAHDCLFEFGRLQEGETVLIQAGAGGVGVAAIQLAKRAGRHGHRDRVVARPARAARRARPGPRRRLLEAAGSRRCGPSPTGTRGRPRRRLGRRRDPAEVRRLPAPPGPGHHRREHRARHDAVQRRRAGHAEPVADRRLPRRRDHHPARRRRWSRSWWTTSPPDA